MQIAHIEGATRALGEAQGYRGLPIRDELQNCSVGGEGTPVMVTEWIPSAEDRYAIFGGANIHLNVVGTAHPPVRVEVAR